jgi:hypothetical protein
MDGPVQPHCSVTSALLIITWSVVITEEPAHTSGCKEVIWKSLTPFLLFCLLPSSPTVQCHSIFPFTIKATERIRVVSPSRHAWTCTSHGSQVVCSWRYSRATFVIPSFGLHPNSTTSCSLFLIVSDWTQNYVGLKTKKQKKKGNK